MLELVVHDCGLLAIFVFELLSDEGVLPADCDGLTEDFVVAAGDELAHLHHGCVGDFGVAFDLEVAGLGDADVFTQHVLSGDSDVF